MTFVDRFTAADSTNIHGRTPSGAPNAYNVTAGSFSIQSNAAQSGAADSLVYIDPEITDMILSFVVGLGSATDNHLRFRWDVAGNTGWYISLNNGTLYYFDGATSTSHGTISHNLKDNGDQWYVQVDLTDPASISVLFYNLQFDGFGWQALPLTYSSSLNNDKTAVGFATSHSGIRFDCLRCQSTAFDYPYQGLLEARIQRSILQDHVPYIISSYDTGTPSRESVWGENNDYSPYYDGPSGLLQLYDLWGATDGALFYEAAWKQFQILHDDYYVTIADPDYGIPGNRSFSRGPYQLWLRMADADAYATVRYLPQRAGYHASGDCSSTSWEEESGLHRECAYALASIVWQNKIGGVAASEVDATRWGVLRGWCYDWVDYWCDEVTPGVYAWTETGRQVAAFMMGLMARSLWDDYTVSADARFPAALLKLCNFIWDNYWDEGTPGLDYELNPDSPAFGLEGINNDLNGLCAAAFAKCAQLTGDQTHRDRADTLMTNVALYGSFFSGKQKNQVTTWLKDYIDWRADFSPVRRSGRLFRRSA